MADLPKTIVIVGSGVFGVTAAIELHNRGHTVTLCDQGPIPYVNASSTDINKLIRMSYQADPVYSSLMEEAMPRWRQWNRDLFDRELYHQSGIVMLTQHDEPHDTSTFAGASAADLEARGVAVEWLTKDDVRTQFPGWNADRYQQGYYNPESGYAESGAVVAALVEEAIRLGVEVVENVRVHSLIERSGSAGKTHVLGVRTSKGEFRRDITMLATGAWTSQILPELEEESILWPCAQVAMHFEPPTAAAEEMYTEPKFPAWLADTSLTGFYGFPAVELEGGRRVLKVGHHGDGIRGLSPDLVSSERERICMEKEAFTRAFLRDAFPGMAGAVLEHVRMCFYCDTFDGDFLIDYHPERRNLFVATGGSGHGFKFAPVLGEIIADAVERCEAGSETHAGTRARFAWRRPANSADLAKKEASRFYSPDETVQLRAKL